MTLEDELLAAQRQVEYLTTAVDGVMPKRNRGWAGNEVVFRKAIQNRLLLIRRAADVGMDDDRIADVMGISKARVRQLQKRALR